MNEDKPGQAQACRDEQRARQDLAELIGNLSTDMRNGNERLKGQISDLRDDIGEEPKTMSTDPEERAGRGMRAILFNFRTETNAKLEAMSKDLGEIKQQLPGAVTQRLRTRVLGWGAVAGALIALATLVVGCYSIAKSVSSLSHSVQVVSVKP